MENHSIFLPVEGVSLFRIIQLIALLPGQRALFCEAKGKSVAM